MLIKYQYSNGNTIDLGGKRYQWNQAGNGDTIEMADEAAQELLDGPAGKDYKKVKPPPETTPSDANEPLTPTNPPTTTFGPGPDSQFAAPTYTPDGVEAKEG